MRLTVTSTGAVNLIRSYADGVLCIGEQRFDRAVMVGPTLLDGNIPVQNPLDLREEQFKLRMASATGQLGQSHLLKQAQRDIARVKTILQQKAGQ